VIIPARNEEELLPRCLQALLLDGQTLSLRIIVVLNGCTDNTRKITHQWQLAFGAEGHEYLIVDSSGGKAAALNEGDTHRRPGPVLYLDADTVVAPGTLPAIARELDTDLARLVSPSPRVVRSKSWLTRGFAHVWTALPAVAGDVIGAGCYAVNSPGRARWTRFPDVVADDAYARSRFRREERIVLQSGGFFLELPPGLGLVPTIRRWLQGNRALQPIPAHETTRHSDPAAPLLTNLASARRRIAGLPAFLLVSLLARCRGRASVSGAIGWTPARRKLPAVPASATGAVQVIVITYNSAADITRCLESLRSSWADLDVIVVDNASIDGSADLVADHHPDMKLIRNTANIGFARAVNRALTSQATDSEHILLVNPDAWLSPTAIDELLALAIRFPDAGIYGGRMVDPTGRLDPTSCLAAPSLLQALAFGLGLSAHPAGDPDSLRRWNRKGVREVPVLTAGLMLMRRDLWSRLGGFTERYFLYGEDVDLNLRARTLDARPMFTGHAVYAHRGGGSDVSGDRMVNILRGKATLYSMHLAWPTSAAAKRFLLAGVLLRRIAEGAIRHRGVWTDAWRRRIQWGSGW
jgi:GT2 family glycosyltransferase